MKRRARARHAAYNEAMRSPLLLPLSLLLAASGALAQAPAPAAAASAPLQAPASPKLRGDQRIERIRIEDGGSRIDELRVGGETQRITVQPKTNVPEYEMQPSDGARSRPNDRDTPGNESQRVWNLRKF